MTKCRDNIAAAAAADRVVDEKDDERYDFSCSWVASCTDEKYLPKKKKTKLVCFLHVKKVISS